MEVTKKAVGLYARKVDFVEGKKVKILNFKFVPDNFKEGKERNVLSVEDREGNAMEIELNNTLFNQLVDWFGGETDDWEGKKVLITAVDDGIKEVEGTSRQCYRYLIEKT